MQPSFSIQEQTGQMLVAGFEGTAVTPQAEELILQRHIGGLILFERNFEEPGQLHSLVRDLQSLAASGPASLPLFISVDQEGGRVSRLKAPFTQFPAAACLGNARSEDLAYRFGRAMGTELRSVGVNMNYAPVLDVNSNPGNPVIGARALSNDPKWVARLSAAIIRGFKEAGVVPVGKHFPGHGDTRADSHLELPVVDRAAAVLEETELLPFTNAISAGLEVIMTAHVAYPAWDENFPATFSHAILQNILRRRLGFHGLIISDDLEMKAIENHFPPAAWPSLGIEAGVDLFLICHNGNKVRAFQDQLLADIERDRVPRERVTQSMDRIVNLKHGLALPPAQAPDFSAWSAAHQDLAEEMRSYLAGYHPDG